MADFTITIGAAPAPGLPAGDLCGRSDIEDIFGIDNVSKWANLSGNDPTSGPGIAEIAGRINTAIAYASAEINAYFREGGYKMPFATTESILIQTRLAATRSGLWLYDNKGGIEPPNPVNGQPQDRYTRARKELTDTIGAIRGGKMRLDTQRTQGSSTGPFAVREPRRHIGGPVRGTLPLGPYALGGENAMEP